VRAERRPPPVPGRAGLLALGVSGALLVGVGWYQAAGTVEFGHQVRSGVLSTAGLAAVSLTVALWTLGTRRTLERRVAALLRSADALPSPAPADGGRLSGAVLVATASMGRYHRPHCPLATDKPVRAAVRSAHEAAGRRPCGVCRP